MQQNFVKISFYNHVYSLFSLRNLLFELFRIKSLDTVRYKLVAQFRRRPGFSDCDPSKQPRVELVEFAYVLSSVDCYGNGHRNDRNCTVPFTSKR